MEVLFLQVKSKQLYLQNIKELSFMVTVQKPKQIYVRKM